VTRAAAQITDGRVVNTIVVDDLAWAEENLEGVWIDAGTAEEPTAPIGAGYDPAFPDPFADDWVPGFLYPKDATVFHDGRVWRSLIDNNVWTPGEANWRDFPVGGFPIWSQPSGSTDYFDLGDIVWDQDQTGLFISTISVNVYPPTGPHAYGWEPYVENPDEIPVAPGPPEWAPWPGFGPGYATGDVVRADDGELYESTIDGNVWPPTGPGAYGWIPHVAPDPDPDPDPGGYPAWEPWTSGLVEDLYQIGDRVTHNGLNWEANTGNNHWEPGVFGWTQID